MSSNLDHSFREATHASTRISTDLINTAVNVALLFFTKNKDLKIQINDASTAKDAVSAARSAFIKGASLQEVRDELQNSKVAQQSANPALFAKGLAVAGMQSKASMVAPHQVIQKEKSPSMER